MYSCFVMGRFVLVVLISLCSFTSAQEYVITRRIAVLDRHSTSHDQPDLIQIPSSLCRNNGTTDCSLMDGQRHSRCQCACDKKDKFSHNYFKGTFGFYNKTWKCEENIAVRSHSGCLLSLYGHSGIEPVLTIPHDRETVDYTIVNATTDNFISVSEGKTCSLRPERSTYMKCNGEWEQLNSTLVTERFGIQVRSDNHFNFWVVSSASSSYPLPSGRIIRLAVTCSDRPWESSQCVVVKVEGELKCPVSPSPSASPSPLHPLSSSKHSMTSTPVHVTSVPNVSPSKDSSKGRKAFSIGLVIGVTLSGVAVLVALLILVVFMIRLRKRFDNQKRKASYSALIENKTHGEVAGGAQKPTHHAGEYADPKGLGSSVDKLPMREEPLYHVPGSIIDDNTAQDEPVYDVLEELPPHGTLKNEALQPDKDPPLYGTFNEPSKKGTSDAPRRGYGNVLYDSVGDQ